MLKCWKLHSAGSTIEMTLFDIRLDDLRGSEIADLLEAHLDAMRAISPPGSVHALDLDALRAPEVRFWTAWEGDQLLGCGALKEIAPDHGEVKSMRTAADHLRKGVAAAILEQIIASAKDSGYVQLSLETGRPAPFAAAHRLYERYGFAECPPFGNYRLDPFSICMTRAM
jgi:putative acetyltransferase